MRAPTTPQYRSSRRGFSLLEVMTVMGIGAVVAGLALTSTLGSMRAYKHFSERTGHSVVWEQIATRFRDELRHAQSAMIETDPKTKLPRLSVRKADGSHLYIRAMSNLLFIEKENGEVLIRFRLGEHLEIALEKATESSIDFCHLVILETRSPQGMPQPKLRVTARVGQTLLPQAAKDVR